MQDERNTLIPFWQYVQWLGLDGWRVAGVSRGQATPSNYGKTVNHEDNCQCLLDLEEKHVSRTELLQNLFRAEQFFIDEAKRFPAPMSINEEEHRVDGGWRINPHKPSVYENLKSFRPFYPCVVQKFGTYVLNLVTTATVNKTEGEDNTPLDTMSIVFDIAEDTNIEDIRLYFSDEECPYCGWMTKKKTQAMEYNLHLCEIRPYCDIVEGVSEVEGMKQITVTFHSYIIVKPSLQIDMIECLENVPETYVDEIKVYLIEKEPCADGYFQCQDGGCGSVPCSSSNMDLCVVDRIVYKEKWAVPRPLQCEVNELNECVCRETCVSCNPDRVVINYITGCELNVDKTVPFMCFEAIAKLSLALQECEKEWCKCDVCISRRIEIYSKVPKELVREGNALEGFGNEYQLLIDKIALKYVDGFVPSRGMIEAMRFIAKHKCENGDGVYVG